MIKQKREKLDDLADDGDGGVMMTIREPFLYNEVVQYFLPTRVSEDPDDNGAVLPPSEEDVETDILADLNDIYPMGYPTEQFITKLKNEIIYTFNKLKEDRKKAVLEMRRQMFEEGGAKMKVERPPEIQRDSGLVDANGNPYEEFFEMHDSQNKVRIATLLRVEDRVYNQLRQLYKDCSTLQIRPLFKHPTKSVRKALAQQKNMSLNDPVTMLNEAGYNPSLERRLNYKNVQCQKEDGVKNVCLNVNYLINDPMYETAFRADVKRIETSGQMAVKPLAEGEIVQSHEFVNVTTTMRETIKIMLGMKFQGFFTHKMSGK